MLPLENASLSVTPLSADSQRDAIREDEHDASGDEVEKS